MNLASIDRELLMGEHGVAASKAMDLLIRYGESAGASEFVSIRSAHIDSCLYHGPSSIDFARYFADLGGRVRVPTTLNVAAVDVTHPDWHCGAPDILDSQRQLTELYVRLGCLPTLTCAPYQRLRRPGFGEHIAWAESNAIVFANSVLGARTDRYGDFADLCAALTGRVPHVGLHRDENRRPTVLCRAPPVDIWPRDLYFSALGYVVGERAAGQVPLIAGLPSDATEDELKALGAAGASSGSLALFHVVGVTPEAHLHEAAHLPATEIRADELSSAVSSLCPLDLGEPVAALCLGTPHYSLDEFRLLAKELRGRLQSRVPVFISTSREIAGEVERDPEMAPIRAFGANIVVDTCTYLAPVVRAQQGAIVTTSAKYAHYGPGNLKRRVGLMTLDRCIRSAEQGRVAS